MVNTPRAAMQAVQQKLAEAGLDSVQFESRILLETVLELPYGAPLPQQPLTEAQQQRLAELTAAVPMNRYRISAAHGNFSGWSFRWERVC